jgi:hypothetical protein
MGVVLRFFGFLILIGIGASFVIYLVTGNRAYLRFAWQIAKYSIILALIALTFLALERIILVA